MTDIADIAQALGVSLTSSGKDLAQCSASIKLPWGDDFPLSMKAVAWFHSMQTGVVFHVAGDLNLVVYTYPELGSMVVMVVDGSKCLNLQAKVTSKMNARQVYAAISSGVVAVFRHKLGNWCVVPLP